VKKTVHDSRAKMRNLGSCLARCLSSGSYELSKVKSNGTVVLRCKSTTEIAAADTAAMAAREFVNLDVRYVQVDVVHFQLDIDQF